MSHSKISTITGEIHRNYYIKCPHCGKKIIGWEDDALCYECGKAICPNCLLAIVEWRKYSGGNASGDWYHVECGRCEYVIIDY